jgi:hypothetical protein
MYGHVTFPSGRGPQSRRRRLRRNKSLCFTTILQDKLEKVYALVHLAPCSLSPCKESIIHVLEGFCSTISDGRAIERGKSYPNSWLVSKG